MNAMRQGCPMRHPENGNCLPAGGFCTAVSDPICEALHSAYDLGGFDLFRRVKNDGPADLKKCAFPGSITIKPDGVNELDPCIYEEIERYANVTVSVMRCKNCGHIEVTWTRQPDTEELDPE